MAIQKVKNKNGEWVIVSGVNKPLAIDSTLSDTSENPVQNKAVKQYVDNAIQNVEIAIDSELSNTSENPIQNKIITEVVTNKQDKIEDIETIRSGAALGATALQEHQDISHLATKEELTSLTNEMIANEEVHAAAYNDLDSRLKDVSSLISGVAVTKEEFQEGIQSVTNEMIANEEVTAAALNELDERVNKISVNVSGETATKVELQDAVTSLTNTILENEEVHAAALNDLNSRIEQIITILNNEGLWNI